MFFTSSPYFQVKDIDINGPIMRSRRVYVQVCLPRDFSREGYVSEGRRRSGTGMATALGFENFGDFADRHAHPFEKSPWNSLGLP
jgi:hypothetical protein